MKITIDEAKCEEFGLTYQEVLMALLIKSGATVEELLKSMVDKEIFVCNRDIFSNTKYIITQGWDDRVMNAVLNSEQANEEEYELRIENLAKSLMEIYPKGKKEGTNTYWKGNVKDIKLKLKKFFKLYGKYTDEEIINAAKNYVQSFNGRYQYMRVLKYFIWKDERKLNSEGEIHVESSSELATILENGSQPVLGNDWTTTIV